MNKYSFLGLLLLGMVFIFGCTQELQPTENPQKEIIKETMPEKENYNIEILNMPESVKNGGWTTSQ